MAVATSESTRSKALDAWRGLIVVVMALDHANALVARGKLESELWTTQYPDYGGDALAFLTRWVTHLAAPGFFFLMGAGAMIFASSRVRAGWSGRRVTTHLTLRGLFLIGLQFAVENPAWRFGQVIPEGSTYVGVLYALGISLIAATLLRRLRLIPLTVIGLGLVIGAEAILPQPTTEWVTYSTPELLLLWPGLGDGLFVLYPALPWLGVTLLGLAFGGWFLADRARVSSAMIPLGGLLIGAFILVRLLGGFGNIVPVQDDGLIAFLNVTKYPPSIAFLALTLGIGLSAAGVFASVIRKGPGRMEILGTFGRVPLFFYITHLWVFAVMGRLVEPDGVGAGLYVSWAVGLAILFPASRWYGAFKARRPPESLWRLL